MGCVDLWNGPRSQARRSVCELGLKVSYVWDLRFGQGMKREGKLSQEAGKSGREQSLGVSWVKRPYIRQNTELGDKLSQEAKRSNREQAEAQATRNKAVCCPNTSSKSGVYMEGRELSADPGQPLLRQGVVCWPGLDGGFWPPTSSLNCQLERWLTEMNGWYWQVEILGKKM